jgi:hypothetical protein
VSLSTAEPARRPVADPAPLQIKFSAAEVSEAIAALHGGKSLVGLLSLEALAKAAPQLAACVAALFNACAATGALPHSWALCSITPIHKGGDPNDPGTYRGIAVGSLLAKLYASLLNQRLTAWCEKNNLRARGQSGFRKDMRTGDQVFVLRTLIEECRLAKDPLFVCFVDFTKAYDTVPRHLLWYKMQHRLGIEGWFLQAVQALYASVPMAVKSAEGLSEIFYSHLGLKQGCPLSPLLFGIFIDDFEQVVEENRATLSLPVLAGSPVPPPLYADDMGLVSLAAPGLQAQLDLLEEYADQWGLTVNVAKTKVVVYKSARSADVPCAVTYKGAPVEVVPSFTYLGVNLHQSKRISTAADLRAESGQRATYLLLQRCKDWHIDDPVLQIKLFRALVLPVMMYGFENWAPSAQCLATAKDSSLERVFRRFLRRVLGLRAGTPTSVLLAEAGQYPLQVDILISLSRVWNRLVSMGDTRLVKQAFITNVSLMHDAPAPNQGSAPWSTQIVSCLSSMAPLLAADGSPQRVDVHKLRDKLQSAFIQSLCDSDSSMTKDYLSVRGTFSCDTFGPAVHLQAVRSRYSRQSLTQLRTGSHWLAVTTATWTAGAPPPRHERYCSRCPGSVVDDIQHMLWVCPALQQQRNDHSSLFESPCDTLAEFFERDATILASFARACRRECQRLREA